MLLSFLNCIKLQSKNITDIKRYSRFVLTTMQAIGRQFTITQPIAGIKVVTRKGKTEDKTQMINVAAQDFSQELRLILFECLPSNDNEQPTIFSQWVCSEFELAFPDESNRTRSAVRTKLEGTRSFYLSRSERTKMFVEKDLPTTAIGLTVR